MGKKATPKNGRKGARGRQKRAEEVEYDRAEEGNTEEQEERRKIEAEDTPFFVYCYVHRKKKGPR